MYLCWYAIYTASILEVDILKAPLFIHIIYMPCFTQDVNYHSKLKSTVQNV